MNIGLDLDGTLTTMDSTVDVFNRETGKELTIDDYWDYDLKKVYGLTSKESSDMWEKHSEEIFDRALPIWDLDAFLYRWSTYKTTRKKRNKIYIVTARPEKYREITEAWLKRNHVEYDGLYMGYHTKLAAVIEHGLDVIIDDKGEHIELIDLEGTVECEAYVIDRPYNTWYKTKNRLYVKDIPVLPKGTKKQIQTQ